MKNKSIQTKVSVGIAAAVFVFSFLISSTVSAHVTVKPNQAGIGAYQTFTVNVPVEKDIPTVGVRLVIPEGVASVTPNVKPGWRVTVKKDSNAEDAKVTEITWTGGSIPVGQRDEFAFSAKTPATETKLNWKAYQTYRDGTVVAWDQDAGTLDETAENVGPYSTTTIINDLAPVEKKGNGALAMSIIALVLAAAGLIVAICAYTKIRKAAK
ncbi:MAG TPA: YcnI family protein [Candidatus Paceibacterota bacterium]|nr:YcnI family protein [Candidatus Paceibacterota bacterium]